VPRSSDTLKLVKVWLTDTELVMLEALAEAASSTEGEVLLSVFLAWVDGLTRSDEVVPERN